MKIICIGLNYRSHLKEFNDKEPSEPVFFLKPDSALLLNNKPFFYPEFSKEIHYETEVVIRISRVGKYIQERFALSYIDAVGLGIDFTARDIQNECRKKGMPWEPSKCFDGAAAVSKLIKYSEIEDIKSLDFSLNINGKQVQTGNTSDMIFGFEKIIAHVSKYMMLKTGDLIFTGTPAGVGPVQINDELEAFMNGKSMMKFKIK